jgi:hypothetical protein
MAGRGGGYGGWYQTWQEERWLWRQESDTVGRGGVMEARIRHGRYKRLLLRLVSDMTGR